MDDNRHLTAAEIYEASLQAHACLIRLVKLEAEIGKHRDDLGPEVIGQLSA